jgi:hypothetical protein
MPAFFKLKKKKKKKKKKEEEERREHGVLKTQSRFNQSKEHMYIIIYCLRL